MCHRADVSGGVHLGNAVSADLRAPELKTLYRNSDTLISRAILYAADQNGERLDEPMPAWARELITPDPAEILDYLKTLHS